MFLSHSANDKAVVRPLAERLRQDGLNPKAEGRRRKAGTFQFRDPLNSAFAPRLRRDKQERRFIPLRLDDAPIKKGKGGSIITVYDGSFIRREGPFCVYIFTTESPLIVMDDAPAGFAAATRFHSDARLGTSPQARHGRGFAGGSE